MTRTYRIARLGALAVGGACCLVGCHQLQTNADPASGGSQSTSPARDGKMTSAQHADMQIAMGRVSERQGDLAAAMASYQEAVKRDGSRSNAYVRMAVVHDRQGEFRESADLYRQAIKLAPGSPDIYCDMGYSLYLQRRWAEAEMNLRQAIALDKKHSRAHNNLALVLAQNGRLNDALSEFRQGGSNVASAHANLAFVLTMERRWDEAREHYRLALAADPSSTELKARLQQLDTLVAKVENGSDDAKRNNDARVVMASHSDSGSSAMPPRQAPAELAAPTTRNLPPRPAAPTRSIEQPREGTFADALLAYEAATLKPATARRPPSAAVSAPQTQRAPATVERVSDNQTRALIPAPKAFKTPKPARPDDGPPAVTKPVIPPPRTRLTQSAQPQPDRSAESPAVTPPPAIEVPKAD
jgi:Tfp pilus assembly protein PilF